MTRITGEAVEAMCDLSYRGKRISETHARYLLEAALPHLTPTKDDLVEAISARLHITTDTIRDGGRPRHLSADTAAVWEAADAVLTLLNGAES
jgi:hypothetical protein